MSGATPTLRLPLAELPVLEAKPWRERVLAELREGARPLGLFGRLEGDRVLLTAILRAPGDRFLVHRGRAEAAIGYHELTTDYPALHCFEREVHEQTGLRVAGHPWLKPIRYSGAARMDDYPFYSIEGKEVHEVAVGPIHAGVIEPGAFRFQCLGEQVHHLEIHLGYQHRGVEALLLKGDPRRLAPLVETIAGDSSVAHAWAYVAAIEALSDCAPAAEVELGRALMLELERAAMHLAGLSGLATDIGFLQGATTYGRLRTTAINTSMRLCGSRFGRGALRPGGIAWSLSREIRAEVAANIELLEHDLAIINDHFLTAQTVQHRLRGVGVVSTAQATELGLVGMIARASGVPIDLRQGMSQGVYREIPVPPTVLSDGDCFARAEIRVLELGTSLKLIKGILAALPWGEPEPWKKPGALAPSALLISLVEGWRGEVLHCLETSEAGALLHYKVQDPSLRNWMGLALAVRNNEISDFPICNKSFDLSYCGNDL